MRKERTGRHNSICREFGRIFSGGSVSYPRLGAQQKPADRYYNRPDRPSREKTGGFIPSFLSSLSSFPPVGLVPPSFPLVALIYS